MAITCPRCGTGFDVTLFQFGHRVLCDCGSWVDLRRGHMLTGPCFSGQDGPMAEVRLGRVTHYFPRIEIAAVEITDGTLHATDTIRICGSVDLTQAVESMQIDAQPVDEATVGQVVGIKTIEPVSAGDQVFKIVP